MVFRQAVAAACVLVCLAVLTTGCCGSSSEVTENTSVTPAVPQQPATPGMPGAAPVQPGAPIPGGPTPTGSPRTLILGSWQGVAHGDTERQLQMLEVAMQPTEPTAEQLARFNDQERTEIAQSRLELTGEGAEAQLARALMGAMVEIMRNVQVTATDAMLTINHGLGDDEDQPRGYTVLNEQGNMLQVQVAPPAGQGGGPETVSFTFNPDGSTLMQLTNEDGESTFYRLTRGIAAPAQPGLNP